MITHGGHGTVIKALAAGVPMLCLPHGRDQADDAARVVAAGAGLRLSRRSDAAVIQAALQRILTERSFRDAARRMADAIAGEAARAPTAVDEVEGLLAVRRQPGRRKPRS